MSPQPDPPSSDSLETLRSAAGIGSKRPDKASYGVSETAIIRMKRQDSARRVGVGTVVGVVLLLAAAAGLWFWWAPSGAEYEVVSSPRAVVPEQEAPAETDSAETAVPEEIEAPVVPAPEELSPTERIAVREEVTERILGWAEAWSRQDVDRYLSYYSAEFVPDSGGNRESWAAQRRREVEQPEWVRVSVVGLQVPEATADRAVANFTQTLRVEGREEVLRRELVLVREGSDWRIAGERTLERLPAG